jgi:hypothetical protein
LPARAVGAVATAALRGVLFAVCAHDDPLAGVRESEAALLVDPETDARLTASGTADWRAAWSAARSEHIAGMRALAAHHGLVVVAASGHEPFEDLVAAAFAERG